MLQKNAIQTLGAAVTWTVIAGDVREVDFGGGFDAVLCDPPYELGFMGKRWDASGVAFDPRVWARVLAACKPGAPLLAFGGTRTYHRMACAIEDAGFEIRDCLAWLYGSGFPKSHDVSKALDRAAGAEREVVGSKRGVTSAETGKGMPGKATGIKQVGIDVPITAPATDAARAWTGYGTALKPAFEPCVLARVPLDGTVANNVTAHGCGALAIDAARIGTDETPSADRRATAARTGNAPVGRMDQSPINGRMADRQDAALYIAQRPGEMLGRWPANVLLDEQAAAMLDAQTGALASGTRAAGEYGMMGYGENGIKTMPGISGDTGGASRFFYTSKASRDDRDHGLLNERNKHPTVKPTDLTEYLARLILPPRRATPRRLLVPFAGSGSEMIGALRAGWDEVVGVELVYFDLARERLTSADTAHQRNLFGDT